MPKQHTKSTPRRRVDPTTSMYIAEMLYHDVLTVPELSKKLGLPTRIIRYHAVPQGYRAQMR